MASNEPLWYGHDPPVQGGPLTSYKYRLITLFPGEITPVTHLFSAIYRGSFASISTSIAVLKHVSTALPHDVVGGQSAQGQ